MKLVDWLKRESVTKSAFADRIGVSPATVTSLCNDGWMGRDVAAAIVRETRGEVGPNDFLVREDASPLAEAAP